MIVLLSLTCSPKTDPAFAFGFWKRSLVRMWFCQSSRSAGEPLTSSDLYWRYGRFATKAAGEPLTFGIDSTPPARERLVEFLESCGLALGEARILGEETNGKRAWGGFATAVVK